MSTSGKVRKKKTAGKNSDSVDASVPTQLIRSIAYRRLPADIRCQVDEAILLRPPEYPTPEAIAEKFDLADRYQVSLSVLKSYARKLETLARPVMTSRLLSQVVGCLKEEERQKMVVGGEVLLLSRLCQLLMAEGDSSLSVADLAKLASILVSAGGKTPTSRPQSKGGSSKSKPKGDNDGMADETPPADASGLSEAVHRLYGLSWPPESATDGAPSKT